MVETDVGLVLNSLQISGDGAFDTGAKKCSLEKLNLIT